MTQRVALVTGFEAYGGRGLNPTSEVVAFWILAEAQRYFKTHHPEVAVHSVIVEENCSSRCEVLGSHND